MENKLIILIYGKKVKFFEDKFKKLERKDFENLFEFEKENKEFFEKFVPPRDEKYFDYQTFIVRNELLLKSQEQHKDYFFIIRNEKSNNWKNKFNGH